LCAMWLFVTVGALAGMISMVVFAWVHALTISDIWFSLPLMSGAGAVVGSVLAWNFRVLRNPASAERWLAYTGAYLGLLGCLAVTSLLVFDPTTSSALLFGVFGMQEADRLFGEALALTAGFTFLAAILMTVLFGRVWWHIVPSLATTALVMATLGSNVVIIGMIDLDETAVTALAEFLGLTALIVAVYSTLIALYLDRAKSATRGSIEPPQAVG
jgi:hypothetical protein